MLPAGEEDGEGRPRPERRRRPEPASSRELTWGLPSGMAPATNFYQIEFKS